MIFEFKERNNCLVNIEKTAVNYYIFGTKKIYAKVMNAVLLVRVGGGIMDIDNFYKNYGEIELQKQIKLGQSPDTAEKAKRAQGNNSKQQVSILKKKIQEAKGRTSQNKNDALGETAKAPSTLNKKSGN
jgi:hypothetical protein